MCFFKLFSWEESWSKIKQMLSRIIDGKYLWWFLLTRHPSPLPLFFVQPHPLSNNTYFAIYFHLICLPLKTKTTKWMKYFRKSVWHIGGTWFSVDDGVNWVLTFNAIFLSLAFYSCCCFLFYFARLVCLLKFYFVSRFRKFLDSFLFESIWKIIFFLI